SRGRANKSAGLQDHKEQPASLSQPTPSIPKAENAAAGGNSPLAQTTVPEVFKEQTEPLANETRVDQTALEVDPLETASAIAPDFDDIDAPMAGTEAPFTVEAVEESVVKDLDEPALDVDSLNPEALTPPVELDSLEPDLPSVTAQEATPAMPTGEDVPPTANPSLTSASETSESESLPKLIRPNKPAPELLEAARQDSDAQPEANPSSEAPPQEHQP
ncbi:MAG TPA: hypothetical protein V6D03_15815, partial [Candidatus Caenarcaniphilales bacterium]